jgi:hypothetical protein
MANTPVNIVYPISGHSYPITNPAPGTLKSAYVTASFSLTCNSLGNAEFYDQISVQFVHKLPGR